MEVTQQFDSGRTWVGTALAAVAAIVVGSLAFPRRVYQDFVWHYFWGPVYADANNARCAVSQGGNVDLLFSSDACATAVQRGLTVAEPGYTVVSEIGYMIILLFMLVGVLQLLRWLDIARDRGLLFALVPFMLFGGALRVVEDANDAVPQGVEPAITYPLNSLIISPIIYFTVFLITLASLLVAIRIEREGYVDTYYKPLALVGGVAFGGTFLYLATLGLTTGYVSWFPQVLFSVVVIATLVSAGIFYAVEEWKPEINAGTGRIGLVVLWGHAIDGVANVIAADWLGALGVNLTYTAKHPANRFIIDATEAIFPQSVLATLGSSWPFLVVKMVVALAVIWIFDEQIFEENPRYAVLLLVAIVAVGLGPGTRDMIRATFGI
jgi:uncharacterized membrane protein